MASAAAQSSRQLAEQRTAELEAEATRLSLELDYTYELLADLQAKVLSSPPLSEQSQDASDAVSVLKAEVVSLKAQLQAAVAASRQHKPSDDRAVCNTDEASLAQIGGAKERITRETLEAKLQAAAAEARTAEGRAKAAEDRASALGERLDKLSEELLQIKAERDSHREEASGRQQRCLSELSRSLEGAVSGLVQRGVLKPKDAAVQCIVPTRDACLVTDTSAQMGPEPLEGISPGEVETSSKALLEDKLDQLEQIKHSETALASEQDRLREQISRLNLQLVKESQEALGSRSELERERVERRGSEAELQRQIGRLEGQLAASTSELVQLRVDLGKAMAARDSACRFVEELQRELQQAESSISMLGSRLDKMETEAASSKQLLISDRETDFCSIGMQTDGSFNDLDLLNARSSLLSLGHEEERQLEERLAVLRQQVSEHQVALQVEGSRLRGAEARAITATASSEAAEARLERLEGRLAAARAIGDLEVELVNANAMVTTLTAELREVEQHFKDLKASMSAEIEDLHDMRVSWECIIWAGRELPLGVCHIVLP